MVLVTQRETELQAERNSDERASLHWQLQYMLVCARDQLFGASFSQEPSLIVLHAPLAKRAH